VNNGGCAFPAQHSIDGNWTKEPLAEFRGMTLRDYFAAKVLQGLCANNSVFAASPDCGWLLVNCTQDQLADTSYELADAMLKARTA